jgi:hypothetical protein
VRATIAVLLLAMLIGENTMAQSQEPTPQAPQIPTEQQPNRPADSQQDAARNRGDAHQASGNPQSLPNDAGKREPERNANKSDDQTTEFWTVFRRRLKITDTFLVGFTFLLFGATVLLWWTTRDLVKGAEDTAERQLRAYVLPEKALLLNINDPTPRYIFHVKNYGQTPARELTVWVGWRYFDIQKIDIPKTRPALPNLSKYLLGPQGFTTHSDIVYLDDTRKQQIRNGAAIFLLFGDVRYKDVFERDRVTTFRFAWGGGYSMDTTGPLDVCAEGNDAD